MQDFLQTVGPQMRLVTVLEGCIEFLNGALVFSMGALSLYLWLGEIASPGDIAIAIALCLQAQRHIALDYVGGVITVRKYWYSAGRDQHAV